ncbi:import receptor subunit tom40 [Anaeramoeba ignava]|uniref:Import receptor subunit tom40 n=1 Tax=Anaeramoeba ignava TaxID=1746090 RepID=A0A9Q0L8J3_ANAIG|nr:import receptor subunit tom40 [Anaeramoeba ignava]
MKSFKNRIRNINRSRLFTADFIKRRNRRPCILLTNEEITSRFSSQQDTQLKISCINNFSTFPAKYFNASYVQKISNRIGLGTEIIYNLDNGESVMDFGFYYRLRQVKVNTEIDYPRDQYLFGYGLRIGPEI